LQAQQHAISIAILRLHGSDGGTKKSVGEVGVKKLSERKK
jgi:hypothetical protein